MSDLSGTGSAPARYQADPYTSAMPIGGGMEAARMVRLMAFVGIAARLFAIYASANRISVCHTLLGTLDANGELNPTNRADAFALTSRAHDADSYVTLALVASLITIVLYLMALGSLTRRRKHGDTLAASVAANRAIRFAGRLYLVAAVCAAVLHSAFKPASDAMPTIRLNDVIGGDIGNMVLQLLVITFLLIVAVTVGREMDSAYDHR